MSCEADFLHANDLGSDTDDEDYDPGKDEAEAAKLSEEEDGGEDHSGDEGGKGKKRRRRKKKDGPSSSAPLCRGVAEEDGETARMKEEFAREKEEKKELEEKAKVDDLWAGERGHIINLPEPHDGSLFVLFLQTSRKT